MKERDFAYIASLLNTLVSIEIHMAYSGCKTKQDIAVVNGYKENFLKLQEAYFKGGDCR